LGRFILGSLALHTAVLVTFGVTLTLPSVTPRPGAAPLITARLAPAEPRAAARPNAITPNTAKKPGRNSEPAAVERSREQTGASRQQPTPHATRERGSLKAMRTAKAVTPSQTTAAATAPGPTGTETAPTSRTKPSPVRDHAAPVSGAPPTGTASVAHPAVRGAAVRTAVERALRARFYYPYVARRNGWQGEIDLGLHISADGHISGVHVVKSSGHGLLDRAALKSARSIKVLPELVDLLYGQALDLVLPVRYRLYDG